jgi:DivIVA domain-containing protein
VRTLFIYVFALVLVGGLLFLAASFAFGRDEEMAPALPDGTPVELPDDRPATGADLRTLRLAVVLRGYRMEEVDWVLDRLAEQVDARDREIARLRSVLHVEPVSADTAGWRPDAEPGTPGPAPAENERLTEPEAPLPGPADGAGPADGTPAPSVGGASAGAGGGVSAAAAGGGPVSGAGGAPEAGAGGPVPGAGGGASAAGAGRGPVPAGGGAPVRDRLVGPGNPVRGLRPDAPDRDLS